MRRNGLLADIIARMHYHLSAVLFQPDYPAFDLAVAECGGYEFFGIFVFEREKLVCFVDKLRPRQICVPVLLHRILEQIDESRAYPELAVFGYARKLGYLVRSYESYAVHVVYELIGVVLYYPPRRRLVCLVYP